MNETCCSEQLDSDDTNEYTTSNAGCCRETTSPKSTQNKAGKAEVMDYDLNEWTGTLGQNVH